MAQITRNSDGIKLPGRIGTWYVYRLEQFSQNDRVLVDKTVYVVADDNARYHIDSRDFAEYVARELKATARVRVIPMPAFAVQKIGKELTA